MEENRLWRDCADVVSKELALAIKVIRNLTETHRQQLLGGNVAMYYIVYVFAMAGMVSSRNFKAATIQSMKC